MLSEDNNGENKEEILKTENASLQTCLKEKEHFIDGLKKTLGHSESVSLELEAENVRLHATIRSNEKEAKHVNDNCQNINFKVDQVTTATRIEKYVSDKCTQCTIRKQ